MGEFTSSVSNWVHNLSINSVIMMIMMIFMIVGAVDKIRGNKKGYGEKFEEGFNAIGPLALSMAGVVAAAPVLAQVLGPIIKPIYTVFGADPSMFATTLLACDMGGYPLAMQLAGDQAIGNFAGLILGTMMGPTIVFTIPVALGIIDKKDRGYLGAGVLAGMITIPIGCVIGGIAMTAMTPYKLSIVRILQNLIPVIIIAGLIVFGLWVAPAKMINGFKISVHAVSRDRRKARQSHIADLTELLALIHLRDMHLHRGDRNSFQRVQYRNARVGIRAGVDHDTVDIPIGFLYFIDQIALMIALVQFGLCADLLRVLFDQLTQIGIGRPAVDIRLADTQHIQVWSVDDKYFHIIHHL